MRDATGGDQTEAIQVMSIEAFRSEGWLQELNRQWAHPRGIAFSVEIRDDGAEVLGPIWHYPDDPEGIVFGPGLMTSTKTEIPEAARRRHHSARCEIFGGRAIQDAPNG